MDPLGTFIYNPINSFREYETVRKLSKAITANINKIIKHAQKASLTVIRASGEELRSVITHAETSYEHMLDLTVDKVDKLFIRQLEMVNQAANTLAESMTQAMESFEKTTDNLQQIASTLPYAQQYPQLTKFPCTVVLSDDPSVFLSFKGVFTHASFPGLAPSLILQDTPFSPIRSSSQKLDFRVPSTLFTQQEPINPLATGKLIVPWKKDLESASILQAIFLVFLHVFPKSPGKLLVEYTTPKQERIIRERSVMSGEQRKPKKQRQWDFKATPTPGWKIDYNKVSVQIHMGGWLVENQHFISKSADEIHYRLNVKKDIGDLNVEIKFSEFQDKTVSLQEKHEINLKWGACHTLPFPSSGGKIVFNSSLDGRCHDLTTASLPPFMTLIQQNSTLSAMVADPQNSDERDTWIQSKL